MWPTICRCIPSSPGFGELAPLTAFQLAKTLSLTTLGIVSAILILFATLLLIPEIRFGRRARKAEALVEEVSE